MTRAKKYRSRTSVSAGVMYAQVSRAVHNCELYTDDNCMTPSELRLLLAAVGEGRIETDEAHRRILAELRSLPYEDLGFARVDHHRSIRQGFPEVILGLGKTPDQIATIASRIVERGHPLLVTRADEAAWNAVHSRVSDARYHSTARAITVRREVPPGKGRIAIVSAGTSDLAVAEEVAVTAELMGNDIDRVFDVG